MHMNFTKKQKGNPLPVMILFLNDEWFRRLTRNSQKMIGPDYVFRNVSGLDKIKTINIFIL